MANPVLPETVKVLVHHTVAVHDTTVRVAAPATWSGILLKDLIGWLVTLFGFGVAVWVARQGWARTAKASLDAQERRQELENENTVRVLRAAIWEGIGAGISLLPHVIMALMNSRYLNASVLTGFDQNRESYDRNKDNMVLWPDEKQRLKIQLWFREMALRRRFLDDYVEPVPGGTPKKFYDVVVAKEIEGLETSLRQGRELYVELDFPRSNPGDPDYANWAPANVQPEPPSQGGPKPA